MNTIKIKPISVNEAYRGRRFATQELKDFKICFYAGMPRYGTVKAPKTGGLAIDFIFGVSSKGCDVDNLIKAAQDGLAEYYGFNDNRVEKITAEKKIVARGKEYIAFNIRPLTYSKHQK